MKLSRNAWWLYGVALFWAAVAWAVVDYNLGFGNTTLRWRNPAHATPVWTWDAVEVTPTTLEPMSGQWMRVTLPRGFKTATLEVRTVDPSNLVLRAEARDRDVTIAQAGGGSTHTLSFVWSSLVARGKTFRFRVENTTAVPVRIQSIQIITTR